MASDLKCVTLLNKSVITGMCSQMCPESEIRMRERHKLLHPMEILQGSHKAEQPIADRNRVIKEFCRSSAGQQMQKQSVLRPYKVLLDTITYLLDEAINNEDFPWHMRYDFIADRLRAVRQDMIIQDLPKPQAISLLQPVVRFYAYASYRMCNEKLQNYDPHLNNKHFQECLKRLLAMYDECEELASRCQQGIKYSQLFEESRPQIEAIYILFNLGNDEVLYRALALAVRWRNTPEVYHALKVSLLYRQNNFVAVCRAIKNLPHLLAALTMTHLPAIRKVSLRMMSCAYSSRVLRFPLGKLQELHCYSNVGDLLEDLHICGIKYEVCSEAKTSDEVTGAAIFNKGTFNEVAKLPLRKEQFIEEKLRGNSVQELVLFGPE